MRPLSRPMFRYGGPIKEGVMSGIREPKRGGGSMTQRVQPSTDGSRPGYAGPATPFLLAGMGIRAALPWAARMGSRYVMPLFRKQVGTQTVQKHGPSQIIKGIRSQSSKGYPGGKITEKIIGPGTVEVPKYGPTWLGSDPLVRTGGKIIQGVTSPTSKGFVQKAARIVLSPTGVATGLIYAGGKFFDGDGNEVPPPNEEVVLGGEVGTSGVPGGGDTGMRGDG